MPVPYKQLLSGWESLFCFPEGKLRLGEEGSQEGAGEARTAVWKAVRLGGALKGTQPEAGWGLVCRWEALGSPCPVSPAAVQTGLAAV